jgi:serine protease Do
MSFFDKLRREKFLSFTLILFTLSVGIVIGTLVNSGVRAAKDNNAAPGATPLVIPNAIPSSSENQFAKIAKEAGPSVVNIVTKYEPRQTQSKGRRRQAVPDDDQDNGMQDFFNRFFGGNPFGNGPEMQQRGEALGSGVVVDKAGYIITNNHVVDKADRIQVKFADDPHEYEAKVVGVDANTDIAVIHVEGKGDLRPAKIGNSDAVEVGDWAIAIGSPFAYQNTLTVGVISAKQRNNVEDASEFQRFLQTDAAINPGNSGGPLLNIRGEVIGINTAILSRSGGNEGIGFALPINTAAKVYNEIIKNGKVTRGSIGITFTSSESDQSRALLKSAGVNEGVFVQDVTSGGPAEKAGIKPGDVIVAIGGKPIHEGNELIDTVTETPVGSTLNISVVRDGKRQAFNVTVGDFAQIHPEQAGVNPDQGPARPGATQAKFGIEIQNLTDARRENLGIKEKGGVLISDVTSNSFADDIGLRQGDILMSINRAPVNSPDDVVRLQSTLKPGDAVAFRILRQQGRNGSWSSAFVAGTLPNAAK